MDDEDLVDKLLKKTGCTELHYKVQECIAEKRDWRQCQEEVKNFRICMDNYNKKKSEQPKSD